MCHMSCVMCQILCVTCHMSCVQKKMHKVVELVGGGLPCLVYISTLFSFCRSATTLLSFEHVNLYFLPRYFLLNCWIIWNDCCSAKQPYESQILHVQVEETHCCSTFMAGYICPIVRFCIIHSCFLQCVLYRNMVYLWICWSPESVAWSRAPTFEPVVR